MSTISSSFGSNLRKDIFLVNKSTEFNIWKKKRIYQNHRKSLKSQSIKYPPATCRHQCASKASSRQPSIIYVDDKTIIILQTFLSLKDVEISLA